MEKTKASLKKVLTPDEKKIKAELKAIRKNEKTAKKIEKERLYATFGYETIVQNKLSHLVPVDQPMILISQVQRSGGTLMNRLFDSHPKCFSYPRELHWGRPKKWNWPDIPQDAWLQPDLFDYLFERWIVDLATHGHYAEPSRKIGFERHPFIFDLHLQRKIFDLQLAQQPPKEQRDILNSYLTSFFNSWLDYQAIYLEDKKFVTAFTPRTIMLEDSVSRFFRDYPDGYIVTQVRHPASWYSSAIRHGYLERYNSLEEIMDIWRQSAQAALDTKKFYGDRTVVLIFEELLSNTEGCMRHICDSTGLSFDPILASPTYNGILVSSNSEYQSKHGIDKAVIERYRTVLQDEDIKIIERNFLPLYEQIKERFSLLK